MCSVDTELLLRRLGKPNTVPLLLKLPDGAGLFLRRTVILKLRHLRPSIAVSGRSWCHVHYLLLIVSSPGGSI